MNWLWRTWDLYNGGIGSPRIIIHFDQINMWYIQRKKPVLWVNQWKNFFRCGFCLLTIIIEFRKQTIKLLVNIHIQQFRFSRIRMRWPWLWELVTLLIPTNSSHSNIMFNKHRLEIMVIDENSTGCMWNYYS